MHKFIYLLFPIFIYGDSLFELLESTKKNNDLVNAKILTQKAKQKEIESVEGSLYPTIDIGGFYQTLNDKTMMMAGDTYSGYAKISYDIYDGGKKYSTTKQKQDELKSSKFDKTAFEKSLSLQVVENFFSIKNIEASLMALNEKRVTLKAQLDRVQQFYEAELSTKDDVEKLQSAYDTNIYNIESLKFQKLTLKHSLELKVGKVITTLDDASFIKKLDLNLEIDENIKSLKAKESSLQNLANSLKSVYLPQINISDTYSIYDYTRTDASHPKGLDHQNKLLLSLNLRVFDNGSAKKSEESILINKQALKSQIEYKLKEQQMLFKVANARVITTKLKIKSASSALIASKSVYETIEKKYKAGIVDNVSYLDALSVKTDAMALYKRSLNDLEVAYAIYYFYAGKNIEEFIK